MTALASRSLSNIDYDYQNSLRNFSSNVRTNGSTSDLNDTVGKLNLVFMLDTSCADAASLSYCQLKKIDCATTIFLNQMQRSRKSFRSIGPAMHVVATLPAVRGDSCKLTPSSQLRVCNQS